MEAQLTEQPMMQRESAKPLPSTKLKAYTIPALVLIALVVYGYSQGWIKQARDKASEVISTALPSMVKTTTTEDSLAKARTAFAAGDANAAVESYRKVISKNPDDLAAYGELGNVYYTLGMRNDAAKAYFDAASKAIEKNQVEIAVALLPVISEGNPMLAAQLNDMLFDAQARTNMAEQATQVSMHEQMAQPMPQPPQ